MAAIHPPSSRIDGVLFSYDNFTVTVNGTSYPVADIPQHVRSEFSFEQETAHLFLMMSWILWNEEEEEAKEVERLRALEERERIIGLAFTMSRIFHRREEVAKMQ